jgi:Uma2 family endonuclease
MSTPIRRQGHDYMDLDDFEELLADKPAHEKWELIGGRVVRMMVGARWQHNLIVGNIASEIRRQLRAQGAGCQVFTETFWLKERFLKLAVFPDVMVRCGPRLDTEATYTNDPVVLVEVMSPGSESRDRVEKDGLYRKLPTLRHYMVVSRDAPDVEILDRTPEGWTIRHIEGLGGTADLDAVGVSIRMMEIYRDVLDNGP